MKNTAVVLALCSAMLCGCGEHENVGHIADSHLKMCLLSDISNIDPQIVSGSGGHIAVQTIFEGLVTLDPKTSMPIPAVAESWEISDDERIYKFFLRNDAFWSDGSPVVAEDFVYSAKRALSPGSVCKDLFFPLENARAFFDGEIESFAPVGIKALDSKILQITLEEPMPEFLSVLAHPCWFPLNERVVEGIRKYSYGFNSGKFFATKFICSNGPFNLVEAGYCRDVFLVKNERYWDKDSVKIKSISFLPDHNQMESEKHFIERFIDIAEVSLDDASSIDGYSSKVEQSISPIPSWSAIAFNMRSEKFQNKELRVALAMAIDKTKVVSEISGSESRIANSVICNELVENKYLSIKYDIDKSKKLLSDAGYYNEEDFPKIKILCCSPFTKRESAVLHLIKKCWKEIGVNVDFDFCEFEQFQKRRNEGAFDVVYTKYSIPFESKLLALESYASWSPVNYGKWNDEIYDKMIREIHEHTGDERSLCVSAAEKYLMQEMPIIPLFFDSRSYLVGDHVSGFGNNPMNIHSFKFVHFTE